MGLLRTTYQHLRRSPYQTLATMGIMSLTFLSTGIFVLVALASHAVLRYFESQPRVVAFFEEELSEERIRAIKIKLEETGELAFFDYVTKEEAFERYKKMVQDEPELQEFATPDILVSSIEVSARQAEGLSRLAEILEAEEGVTELAFQEELIEDLISWMRFARMGGAILVSLLIFDLGLITLMFIGLKIRMKRDEISIMQLLGAPKWQIRAPFILEGVLYGMAGSAVAWGAIQLLLWVARPYLLAVLVGIPIFPDPRLFMLIFLAAMVVVGIFIGVVGSLIAALRYVRE